MDHSSIPASLAASPFPPAHSAACTGAESICHAAGGLIETANALSLLTFVRVLPHLLVLSTILLIGAHLHVIMNRES